MSGRFFYGSTLSFACGVLISSLYPGHIYNALLLALIGTGLAITARLFYEGSTYSISAVCGVVALSFSVGYYYVSYFDSLTSPLQSSVGSAVVLQGVVEREVELREKTRHVYLTTDSDTKETVLLFVDLYQPISYGDRITVEGELMMPASFDTDLGRTFNYPGYLKARGVTYTMLRPEITVLDSGAANPYIATLLSFKYQFMETVERFITEPAAGLGEGVLLGVKRALGEELESVFRKTGIIHIVVLSGYNVMIVVEAIMLLLAYMFGPRVRLLVGIFAIVSFALLVGLGATVMRASVMAAIVLIARSTGRRHAITRALIVAGIAMISANPYVLAFDPGFQLSFLATLGLIFIAPHIESRLSLVPTMLGIREFFTATLATQIAVLPLLLYLIGEFSVVAVLVNVLVLPMVPVAMLFTFLTGIFGVFIPVFGQLFGLCAFFSLQYVILIAEFFAKLPFVSFSVPQFSFVWVVVSYGAITLLLWRLGGGNNSEEILIANTNKTADVGLNKIDFSKWTIVEIDTKKGS